MHGHQQQQDAAVAVPHAVHRVKVLLAPCVQVQGLRSSCLLASLHRFAQVDDISMRPCSNLCRCH